MQVQVKPKKLAKKDLIDPPKVHTKFQVSSTSWDVPKSIQKVPVQVQVKPQKKYPKSSNWPTKVHTKFQVSSTSISWDIPKSNFNSNHKVPVQVQVKLNFFSWFWSCLGLVWVWWKFQVCSTQRYCNRSEEELEEKSISRIRVNSSFKFAKTSLPS